MPLIDHTRRYVVATDLASLAHLAAEGLLRRQTAAAFTFECRGSTASKTLQKMAAEGFAARITAAQLPLVATPEGLRAAVAQLAGEELAQLATDRLTQSRSVVAEREQPSRQAGAELLNGYLNAPGTGLQVDARPADAPASTPEPSVDTAQPDREPNAVGEDAYPPLAAREVEEVTMSIDYEDDAPRGELLWQAPDGTMHDEDVLANFGRTTGRRAATCTGTKPGVTLSKWN